MKRYTVSLTLDAIADLAEIYEFIAEQSDLPEIAWRYIERLHEKCRTLEHAHVRGQQCSDVRPGLRIIGLEKNAVAAFEVDDGNRTVTTLNIFYGAQDYETLMGAS